MTNRSFADSWLSGVAAGVVGASLWAAPAAGKAREETPRVLNAVAECRRIVEDAARLRCFDQASAALDTALAEKKLYALDKTQVQTTRRTLFGLPLPNLGIFGESTDGTDAVRQIDGTVASAQRGSDDNWTFVLEDGAVWHQTDGYPLGKSPRVGDKVIIKRATLGAYRLSIGNTAVKVARVR